MHHLSGGRNFVKWLGAEALAEKKGKKLPTRTGENENVANSNEAKKRNNHRFR